MMEKHSDPFLEIWGGNEFFSFTLLSSPPPSSAAGWRLSEKAERMKKGPFLLLSLWRAGEREGKEELRKAVSVSVKCVHLGKVKGAALIFPFPLIALCVCVCDTHAFILSSIGRCTVQYMQTL